MPMLREVEGFFGSAFPLWAPTRKPGEPKKRKQMTMVVVIVVVEFLAVAVPAGEAVEVMAAHSRSFAACWRMARSFSATISSRA